MRILQHRLVQLVVLIILISGCRTAGTVPAGEAAEAWYNLGNAYTELGRHDDAVKAYIKARQLNPELINAGFNLARIHIVQKNYNEALAQVDELLELDSQNRLLLETRAWVLHLQGLNSEALDVYNSVLEIFPDSRNSLYNSALMLVEVDESEEALERFRRHYELYPEEKSVVYEIAKIEAGAGNYSEALLQIQHYLETEPEQLDAVEFSGDMYSAEKRYSEAVTAYRIILDRYESVSESEDPDVEPVNAETAGRVYYKTAEILLLSIEDSEAGISALQSAVNLGWQPEDEWELLLSASDKGWYEEAVSIIPEEKETPESDEPGVE